jgi:hypothetical protein
LLAIGSSRAGARTRSFALIAVGALHGLLLLGVAMPIVKRHAARPEPALQWLDLMTLDTQPQPAPNNTLRQQSNTPQSRPRAADLANAPPSVESPATTTAPLAIDWLGSAEAVARESAASANPKPNPFAHLLPAAPSRPPRSVFPQPADRVGQTIRNPDGELVTWVSDNCYAVHGSDSIAMREIHAMHKGMVMCHLIPLRKMPARGDLLDELPSQQRKREKQPN